MLRFLLAAFWFCLLAQSSIAQTPDALLAKSKTVLSLLDGDLALPGLKEPVEVLRDRWGVPHIYAKNADDLFFAQGFVVAQDRLFQLDLWRRIAIGETAAVLGQRGLDGDRFARLLKYRGDMQAEWTSYSPETQAIATSFTRGINAAIDHCGDRLPIEFQILEYKPAKWQPEDILGRMSGIIMIANFRNEVLRAELIAVVGIEKARRIAPVDPTRDFALAAGLDPAGLDRTILAGYEAATRPLNFAAAPPSPPGGRGAGVRGSTGEQGSNNWAISGSRSASGKPMMASDPHRNVTLPALRYLTHLHAPGWHVIGAGEPGLPGVAIGHNEHVAWGPTIVTTDQADLYVEETKPGEPTQYKVGDRWEAMQVIKEKVQVKGDGAVEVELRFTRHGPVLHQDEKRGRAFALRWSGSEPGGAAYLGSLALNRATNGKDFVARMSAWKVPSANLTWADTDGNIGWVANALTPIRKGWDGLLPVPGARGEYEWQGFRATKDLPQVFNPPSGYVATANHNILTPGYPHDISFEWAPSFRFLRIKERMDPVQQFELKDSRSIQHDNVSLPGRRLARLAANLDVKSAELEPYRKLLAGWDGELALTSQAGPLYGHWQRGLLDAFYKSQVPEKLVEFVRSRQGLEIMLTALEKPDAFWFGPDPAAGRDALLRTTFAAAVKHTKAALGDDPKTWAWGKLHTTTLRHPLASKGEAYAKAFNLAPTPKAGDGSTPNAAGHNPKFEHQTGASYRHIFDLADWDRGLATSVPGQSAQPGSPHYGDLLPLWATGEYFPLAFSRKKVEEVMKHKLILKPAK
ncbi:MAG: penicillin acylase family protein [Planctomycetia bacterium]|nr:penicillin acylase family protein [Planctomycetia bacterium]